MIGPVVIQAIIDETGSNWMGFPFLFAICFCAFLVIVFWVDIEKGRRDAAAWSVIRSKVTEKRCDPPTPNHAKDEREEVHNVDVDAKEREKKEKENGSLYYSDEVEANKDKESDKITV